MNGRLVLRMFVVLMVAAAAFGAWSAEAATILKFSHTDQMQGARQAAAELFGKKVKEYTQGRYEVRVFCCSQLGNDPKNIEQLTLGGIDFTVSSTGSYAPHVDTLNLTMLPFLVDNYAQGWKLYDASKWLQKQFDKAPAKGFRFLSTFEAGFRCMTTKDPLRTPEDAKGKKLRTFPNEMMRWTLEAVGFTVQIMPLPEVYLAIQQGTVSGQENPIDTIFSNKFYEVAPYVTLTKARLQPDPAGHLGENLAETLAGRPRCRDEGREGSRGLEPQGDRRHRGKAAQGNGGQGSQGDLSLPGALPRGGKARVRQGEREIRQGRGGRIPRRCRGRPESARKGPGKGGAEEEVTITRI